jgi:PIN domain nuclease of toxin-antitoxin system
VHVPSRAAALGLTAVAVEHQHALGVASLPPHHRDPFDRLLVAQAGLLGVPVITADPVFERYGVEVLAVV